MSRSTATIAPEPLGPTDPSKAFIVGNLAACSFLWGSSYLFIKLMAGEVSPWAIAAGRGGGIGREPRGVGLKKARAEPRRGRRTCTA